MLKKLKAQLKKNNVTTSLSAKAAIVNRPQNRIASLLIEKGLLPYIEEACSLLDIDCQIIECVAALVRQDGKDFCLHELDMRQIKDINYLFGGYILPDIDSIYIAQYVPDRFIKPRPKIMQLTSGELLFNVLHELRHAWQFKYHHEQFYTKNAIGNECINDPAEIDADAFAIADLFSEKTPFNLNDVPVIAPDICYQSSLDGNKRWDGAEKLAHEYELFTDVKSLKLKAPMIIKSAIYGRK